MITDKHYFKKAVIIIALLFSNMIQVNAKISFEDFHTIKSCLNLEADRDFQKQKQPSAWDHYFINTEPGGAYFSGAANNALLLMSCCVGGADPVSITMLYTGEGCSATSTTQDAGKWSCSGDPAFDPLVYIISNDDDNPGSGDIWFSGSVALNGTYTINAANAGQSKLSNATFVHIFDQQGGTLLQSIEFHTSCSQPINLMDQYGANQIQDVVLDDGTVCSNIVPPNPDCCDGAKIVQVVMEYTGEDCSASATSQDSDKWSCSGDPAFDPSVYIIGNDDSNPGSGDIWFSGTVALNEQFTLDATNAGQSKLANATFVHIFDQQGGTLLQSIEFHTSCSQPIGINDQYGANKIVGLLFDDNTFCGTVPNPPSPDCCDDADPAQVTMEYTGEDCSATNTSQDAGKWSCSGDPNFDPSVYIVANDDSNPGSGDVWFAGNVNLNGLFVIDAANAGQSKLSNATFVHVFNQQGGTLLQSIEFHTSCSQPISIDDQYGSIKIRSILFDDGTMCGPTICIPLVDGGMVGFDESNCGPYDPELIINLEDADGGNTGGGVDCCDNGGDPNLIRMRYTGEDCSATVTTQDAGKWDCSGDPNFDPSVYIIANDDSSPGSGDIWFSGTVALNGTFDIDAANAGQSKLSNATFVHIFAQQGGTLLQSIEFHTSCSQPLAVGDQWGAAQLIFMNLDNGASCGNDNSDIEYQWLASISGCPTDISQAINGANGSEYNPPFISQTTWYVRWARRANCVEGDNPWVASNCIIKEVVNLSSEVSNIVCNDNGTPSDPSDDTFSFDLTVNNGQGTAWTAVIGGTNFSGSFGITINIGDFSISGGSLNFTINDNGSNCTANETVAPPPTCSDTPPPMITHVKNFVSVIQQPDGSFNAVYAILVNNLSAGPGQYDLLDRPLFENDVTINSASFTSNAPGNAGGTLFGMGPWVLANDQNMAANGMHTYTLTVNVSLDLTDGLGDDIYHSCGSFNGIPQNGEGLFNQSELDIDNDGVADEIDDACGDLPFITHQKNAVTLTDLGNGTFNAVYTISVENLGGASGQYDLSDMPIFDNDISINSASYTSDAAGNPGGNLPGNGPWTLANDQPIDGGENHTYTLTVNISLSLNDGIGDDSVSDCPVPPQPGQALFNVSRLDVTNDGNPDETDNACLPPPPLITHQKDLVSVTQQLDGSFNVAYNVTVSNLGGTSGQYDLNDSPEFDNDININSASYTSNAPGNFGSTLFGSGPWTLANDQTINAGATHTYTLLVNVSLNLNDGTGDNLYNPCGATSGIPQSGEGLYNRSLLDINNDGTPDEIDDACGDIPAITHQKNLGSISLQPNGTYVVTYTIAVNNQGGAAGQYDLSDVPQFEDDVTINAATYSSTAPGNAGGALPGTGPWTLADNQNIAAGATHNYTLSVNVTLNLSDGNGDNSYTACGSIFGIPQPGEGLYNESQLDLNNDGVPEEIDNACGDLPAISHQKSFGTMTLLPNGTYNVTYTIDVTNSGGATGQYDLMDVPLFEDDVMINSASYTSTAPGNGGGALAGLGPWTLANDQSILAGAIHSYNLLVNISFSLNDGQGNNTYTACGSTNGTPQAGEGLFNESRLDLNNDGIPEEVDDACSDLPAITHLKDFGSVALQPDGSYNVTYHLTVSNIGGAPGQYDLTDVPQFDDDISINSASYSSTAPGNAGGNLFGTGPWTLANNQSLPAGFSHTYTLTVNVNLSLNDGAGNDTYTACGQTTGTPQAGEGLFNESELDVNNDGIPDEIDDACGDLPVITHEKSFVSANPQLNGSFNVSYLITVTNQGGANGLYDLTDTPSFDDDFTINSASFVSNAPGNPGSALAGTGPWTLANDQVIVAGATHSYTLTVNVTLDLDAGGGDNVYQPCSPNNPQPGQGLFNETQLDVNNDGIPDETDEACGDVPDITHQKDISSISLQPNGTYDVTYTIAVSNEGGAAGQYDLHDAPQFDNDISINSANYASDAPGNAGNVLLGGGPWTLANDQSIAVGATHTYTLTVNVSLSLTDNTGDNSYSACGSNTGTPQSGEGLYNQSLLDENNDGIPDEVDDACGDLPVITHQKDFDNAIQQPDGSFNVTYTITVTNIGGAQGQYDLDDTPTYDDDISINSASYTSTAPGNFGNPLFGTGPWNLANNQLIGPGMTHIYTLLVNVSLDLNDGLGNNVYTACGALTGTPQAGEGLFNESRLDINNDGIPDEIDTACGNLPAITHTKNISTIELQPNGTYNVTYNIVVINEGGLNGQYDLLDTPLFDDDISINSASYTSTAPGYAGGALFGSGPWSLANDQAISIGASHTYNLVVNVTLNLSDGFGNDVYTACGNTTGTPVGGEGLYNQTALDVNNDGVPEETDDACGDLPAITHNKAFQSVTTLVNGTFDVFYTIAVMNNGGVSGQYDLEDTPFFDNDVQINSASYSSNAPGNPGGPLFGNGPWMLADDQNIAAGGVQTYTLQVNVSLQLMDGQGDNSYVPCPSGTPPQPNTGLFNQTELDLNNDGNPEEVDQACGNLPSKIGDFVWEDQNRNGVQDINESGVPNILVNLKNAAGAVIETTATGFDGGYCFTDLTPGNYSVQFILPSEYKFTSLNTGFDDSLDSDADETTNGMTPTVTVTEGTTDLTIDGGIYIRPNPGIADPCGCLNNSTSDADGHFFEEIAVADAYEGDTWIIIQQTGMYLVSSPQPPAAPIPVPLGTPLVEIDTAGNMLSTYIYDFIHIDESGYSVTVTNGFDTLSIASVCTYPDFINLDIPFDPLCVTDPPVPLNGIPDIPGDVNFYLDGVLITEINPSTLGIGTFELTVEIVPFDPDECIATIIVPLVINNDCVANLGDRVWEDLNANGLQDTGEPGIPNVTVKLLDGGGNLLQTTTTNGQGIYGFFDLAPGNYQVMFVAPPGYEQTVQDAGNDELDSDAGVNGMTAIVNLDPGETDNSIDAGYFLPNITHEKTFASVVSQPNGTFDVTYNIIVSNQSNGAGQYDLIDYPEFDDDVVINTASFSSNAPGNPGIVLAGSGPWQLANDQFLAAGTSHLYTLVVNVSLLLNDGHGNNTYEPCGSSNGTPQSGEGLYNRTELDLNNDGIPEEEDDACGDLPSKIGDFVWEDRNRNGIQDIGEAGIGGVIVNLKDGSGVVIQTTTTLPDGSYCFPDLDPGTYSVQFINPDPSLYSFTIKDAGNNDELDSDADDSTNGMTPTVDLPGGTVDNSFDGGFYLVPIPAIENECTCLNNNTTADDGQFFETVLVSNTYAGETWTIIQQTGCSCYPVQLLQLHRFRYLSGHN